MSGENATQSTETTDTSTNTETGASTTVTETETPQFTQADLERIVGERVARAERAAVAKITETLGVDPQAAAQQLKELEDLRRQNMNDVERAQADAVEAIRRAEAIEAQATARIRQGEIRDALDEASEGVVPVNPAFRPDAVTLVETEIARNSTSIEDAVAAVRQRVPALFGTSGGTPPPSTRTPPPPGRPSSERTGNAEPTTSVQAKNLLEGFLGRTRGRESAERS